jgi:hypothetical protein
MAATQPSDRVTDYPEPQNHGVMPAYGFFVRHVKNLEIANVRLTYGEPDVRPPFVIEHAQGVELRNVKARRESGSSLLRLRQVEGFTTHRVEGMADTQKQQIDDEQF